MPAGLKRYWAAKRRGKSKTKRGGYRMSKYRTHRSKKITLPLAVILGFMPLVAKGVSDVQAGGFGGLANTVPAIIPYDPATRSFTMSQLHMGLWPILAGFLVHKFIGGAFGVNRALSRMGLPWVRI